MSEQSELEFTGERFTPECVREMAYEHWHRYAWASRLVAGKAVLDAACGEGYGSHLLSATAASVTGLDISEQAVEHARSRYRADNLAFDCGDATALPYEDARFDVVVSFETLEHLADHDALMSEFRRVLRPEGFLVVSSPDRATYSDASGYDNPYHVRELYRPELEALIGRHFPAVRLLGQKLLFASAVWRLDASADGHEVLIDEGGTLTAARVPDYAPLYYIALAAAGEEALPTCAGLSLFADREESVYAHYNDEVARHIRAGELLAEREAEIRRLRALIDRRPWWQRLIGGS
jgi:SAM-dependent methyltransferase